ncbi:hypothetical protein B0H16DRAFT_1468900 [Mycena metata]|uniref:Uncharacterized protein n=1 Tax=Mycena metata TaxID=1033252 RepID=A0AAD7MTW8_9AGAR|nr:hypothetical protein B0H16DRAFT_1468900 [Mycena metata]
MSGLRPDPLCDTKSDLQPKTLSEITKEDLTALDRFTLQTVSAYIFRGEELNYSRFNIIGDILRSQTQAIMQQLDVSDNLVGESPRPVCRTSGISACIDICVRDRRRHRILIAGVIDPRHHRNQLLCGADSAEEWRGILE